VAFGVPARHERKEPGGNEFGGASARGAAFRSNVDAVLGELGKGGLGMGRHVSVDVLTRCKPSTLTRRT